MYIFNNVYVPAGFTKNDAKLLHEIINKFIITI